MDNSRTPLGHDPFSIPYFDPRTIHHPYTHGVESTMQNADPDNEYMYQMPIGSQWQNAPDQYTSASSYERAAHQAYPQQGYDDQGKGRQTASELDLHDLNQRLAHLGLKRDPIFHQNHPFADAHPPQPPQLGSAFVSPKKRHHRVPSAVELRPQDSISMYRLAQPRSPSAPSLASRRRGGTNVDGAESENEQRTPPRSEHDGHTMRSYATRDEMTVQSPRTEVLEALEKRTYAPTTGRTTGTLAGDMYDMRARLLSAHAADERGHAADLSRQLNDASQLASALSKLSSTENQLRQVQATLIAERVARTQVEQEHDLHVGDARGIKTELAGAVRALRKAKFEGKRVEEERRRLARAFEEAKTQLYRYHEELKVRDARAMGREEGRQEAWQEAERWMGGSPPIPVDPVHSLPDAVLHQTPMQAPRPMPLQAFHHQAPQSYAQPAQQGPQYSAQPLNARPTMAPPLPPHPSGMPYQTPAYTQQSTQAPMSAPPVRTYSPPSQATRGQPPQWQPFAFQPAGQDRAPQSQAGHAGQYTDQQIPAHRAPNKPLTTYTGTAFPAPSSLTRPPPGQSYIDQLDAGYHSRLDGTGSGTYNLSNPGQGQAGLHRSRSATGPLSTAYQAREGSGSVIDKPLPNPLGSVPMKRTHSVHPSGTHSHLGTGLAALKTSSAHGQRHLSLSEGLHAHAHSSNRGQIGEGDRYPPFPHVGQGHSHASFHRGHTRQSSFGSVDPGNVALPPSTVVSPSLGGAGRSARQAYSRSGGHDPHGLRGRVAGALRNDGDIDDSGLSGILEAEEPEGHPRQAPQGPESRARQNDSQPAPRGNMHRRAPSVPSLRKQPIPVMPTRLGGTEAPDSVASDSRFARHSAPFGHQPTAFSSGGPARAGAEKSAGAHPMYVPPGLAPHAVSGGVQDVAVARHSALGLEGMSQEREDVMSSKTGRTRAPTITIHPPSTRSANKPSSASGNDTLRGRIPPPRPDPTPLQPDSELQSQRQIYEQPDAHRVPLPSSRPHAPTVYSGYSPRSARSPQSTLSALSPISPTSNPARSRPPPPTLHSLATMVDQMPQVNVIDYIALASGAPLPPSRPTTIGMPTPKTKPGNLPAPTSPSADTEPVYHTGTREHESRTAPTRKHPAMEPRMVPLPSSRGTVYNRPRASSYARTEGTIEEVTEEESGRETRSRSRRW